MKNVTKQIKKIHYLILLLLLSCLPTLAQNGVTVKGTVVDGNGETVIGASVVVKNNNSIGTISDIDGNFTLVVPNDKMCIRDRCCATSGSRGWNAARIGKR